MKSSKVVKKYPERVADVPVTQAMLYIVRDELKADVGSVRLGLDSVKLELKSDIKALDSKIEGMQSELHRVALLIEEQSARNAIVMDGLNSLFDRQDRVEAKVDKLANP